MPFQIKNGIAQPFPMARSPGLVVVDERRRRYERFVDILVGPTGLHLPLNEATGATIARNAAYGSRVGANVVANGTFATDTVWSKGTGWTIGSGVATHAAGTGSDLSQASILTTGDTYTTTLTVSGRTAGTLIIKHGSTGILTISADGAYTISSVADGTGLILTASADFDGSVDDVITQLTGQLDGQYVNTPTLGGDTLLGQPAPTFDSASSEYVQLEHNRLESVFDPEEMTLIQAVNNSQAVWESATVRGAFEVGADASNRAVFYHNTANQFAFSVNVGGVSRTSLISTVTSAVHGKWAYFIGRASKAGNFIKIESLTQTGGVNVYPPAATWTASNLTSSFCRLGTLAGVNYALGGLGQTVLLDYALTDGQVDTLKQLFAAQESDAA